MPTLTRQPAPPRGLKLPTLSAAALDTLADRSRVASVNAVLFPHAPSTDGSRSQAQTPRYPPLSPAAYMRGVMTIAAYRTYYFPDMALQWLTYLIWLQGQAAALTTSGLRDLDERARSHLACYPSEYHDAASLSDSMGLIGVVPVTAPGHSASRSAVPAAPRPAGNELCLRFNHGRCLGGDTCWRQHACVLCRGPHPAQQCPSSAPGPFRQAPPRMTAAPQRGPLQRQRWQ